MVMSIRTFVFLLALLVAAPAIAWKGTMAGEVRSIESVRENGEKGDRVAIRGQVVQEAINDKIWMLRGDTGEMYVRIPESLRRSTGSPKMGDDVICWGRYTNAYLDEGTWGVHCQKLEIVGDEAAAPAR
jgi:hypothetical protein